MFRWATVVMIAVKKGSLRSTGCTFGATAGESELVTIASYAIDKAHRKFGTSGSILAFDASRIGSALSYSRFQTRLGKGSRCIS
jgi:hypothetical protein